MKTSRALLVVAVMLLVLAGLLLVTPNQLEPTRLPSSTGQPTAAESSLAFHKLKGELQKAKREQTPAQVASWKARAELLALQVSAMDYETLLAIYGRLLGFEFNDAHLRARLEGAVSRLGKLTSSAASAAKDLSKVVEKLGNEGLTQVQREAFFGELEAFEVFFYRTYKSSPKQHLSALFLSGKAAHARYFQGVEYLDQYIAECARPGIKCPHLKEAKILRGNHQDLIEKFE